MEFRKVAHVLAAVQGAEEAGEAIDVDRLAADLGVGVGTALMVAEWAEGCGLAYTGLVDDEMRPVLLNAGRQYLDMRGEVDLDALYFLPRTVDDLHAREALRHAGSVMVDEFRYSVVQGNAVAHAREIVPPAFIAAVDERLAIDLFAASVALTVRLSSGDPAACVAEEIVAVELISQAESWLEMKAATGDISEEAARTAIGELNSLFDLFQDEDVLDLFEMAEPADAAVAGHTARNVQLGVVDQRVGAWFRPFGGAVPTGYLDDDPE
jgi:hypothetical protein